MEGQQIDQQYLASRNKKSSGVSKILVVIVGLIVLVLIGVSAYLLRGQFSQFTSQPSPTPSTEAIIEPSPSPSPTFDRSKFTLRVLNGTSKSGLASSVSAKLKDLGYSIDKTGNASGSAVKQTLVRVKSGNDNLLQQLISDLTPDFQASGGANLNNSDSVDAEVVLGNQ